MIIEKKKDYLSVTPPILSSRNSQPNEQLIDQTRKPSIILTKLDKIQVSQEISESVQSNDSEEVIEPKIVKFNEGFKNTIWKERALNVIVLVARFVTYLLTNSDKFKLRYLELRQFRVIGDMASDYNFYIAKRLIRAQKKQQFCFQFNILMKKFLSLFLRFGIRIKPIMPDHPLKLIWDIIVLAILIINIIYIPMKISFEIENTNDGLDFFLETLPQYVFICEILLNFNVAYYSRGILVLNQLSIIKHYLKGKFLTDFIVLIPFLIGRSNVPYIEFVLLFRLTRIIFIFENTVETLNLRVNFAALIDIISLLSTFLFASHLIACVWHFIAVQEHLYQDSIYTWADKAQLDENNWFDRYVTSFYWACVTALTIGYGDIVPVTQIERIFVIFVTVLSSIIFGYTISSIGGIFAQMSESKNFLRDKMTMIDSFIKKRGLNKELQVKVKKFFEYYLKTQKNTDSECEKLFQHLSGTIIREVKIDFYKQLFIQSKLFRQNFSDTFIEDLCLLVKEQSFVPEEIIFQEGDLVNKVYFILKGEVEASVRNNKLVKLYKRKQVIDEKGFISQNCAQFTSRAAKFSKLAYVEFEDMLTLLKQNQQDLERYYRIKHQIVFEGRIKFSGCELCYQNHSFTKCPFVFYTPNTIKIFKKQSVADFQTRIYHQRSITIKPMSNQTKRNLRFLQKSILEYGNHKFLYADLLPNCEFFNVNRNEDILGDVQSLESDSENSLESPDGSGTQFQHQVSSSSMKKGVKHQNSLSKQLMKLSQEPGIQMRIRVNRSTNKKNTQNQQYPLSNKLIQDNDEMKEVKLDSNLSRQSSKQIISNLDQQIFSSQRVINLDPSQIQLIQIEIAKQMQLRECQIDVQKEFDYYDPRFNLSNIIQNLFTNKRKKMMFQINRRKQKKHLYCVPSKRLVSSINLNNINST